MTKTLILLFPIDYFERKEVENIENNLYTSDNFHSLVVDMAKEKETNILAYHLTDFMDACNNQEINLEEYWVTYVRHLDVSGKLNDITPELI